MRDALRSLEAACSHLKVAANDIEMHSGDPILQRRAELLLAQASALQAEVASAVDRDFACRCKRATADALIANYRKLYATWSRKEDGHRSRGGRITEMTTIAKNYRSL